MDTSKNWVSDNQGFVLNLLDLDNLKNDIEANKATISELNDENQRFDNQENRDKLVDALEKLEDSHEKRIDAGVDKDPLAGEDFDSEALIKITESVATPTEGDREVEDLLHKIKEAEHNINELVEMENRADKNRNLKAKREKLLESLKDNISEINKKLKLVQAELEEMKGHQSGIDSEEQEKDVKINSQNRWLEELRDELKQLKLHLKELEGLSIGKW